MKTTILLIILIIVIIFWTGEPTITMKPFSFKMVSWLKPISFIMMSAGLILYGYDSKRSGYNNCINDFNSAIEQAKNDHEFK